MPLDVVKSRDPKGLYAKVAQGLIKGALPSYHPYARTLRDCTQRSRRASSRVRLSYLVITPSKGLYAKVAQGLIKGAP